MRNGRSENLKRLAQETAEVEAAVKRAVRKALQDHKRTGDPIVVYEEGEVRWIPANEIRLPPLSGS
jgi:hypothetical protein